MFDIIDVPKDITFFLQAEIRENGRCSMVLNTSYVVGILRLNTVYPPVYTGKKSLFLGQLNCELISQFFFAIMDV